MPQGRCIGKSAFIRAVCVITSGSAVLAVLIYGSGRRPQSYLASGTSKRRFTRLRGKINCDLRDWEGTINCDLYFKASLAEGGGPARDFAPGRKECCTVWRMFSALRSARGGSRGRPKTKPRSNLLHPPAAGAKRLAQNEKTSFWLPAYRRGSLLKSKAKPDDSRLRLGGRSDGRALNPRLSFPRPKEISVYRQ